jgi:hypothetical protein
MVIVRPHRSRFHGNAAMPIGILRQDLHRRLLLQAGLIVTLLLSGCHEDMFLRIEPGSTKGHLVLIVSSDSIGSTPPAQITDVLFAKQRCQHPGDLGALMWEIVATNGIGPLPAPARIVYGTNPAGYSGRGTAMDLSEGCYRVDVSAPPDYRTLLFTIDSTGAVR